MTWESWIREHIENGELVPVLETYRPPFPRFHLDFSRRRHRPAVLRALIDYLRGSVRE